MYIRFMNVSVWLAYSLLGGKCLYERQDDDYPCEDGPAMGQIQDSLHYVGGAQGHVLEHLVDEHETELDDPEETIEDAAYQAAYYEKECPHTLSCRLVTCFLVVVMSLVKIAFCNHLPLTTH